VGTNNEGDLKIYARDVSGAWSSLEKSHSLGFLPGKEEPQSEARRVRRISRSKCINQCHKGDAHKLKLIKPLSGTGICSS